jgi:hypothetical protein
MSLASPRACITDHTGYKGSTEWIGGSCADRNYSTQIATV